MKIALPWAFDTRKQDTWEYNIFFQNTRKDKFDSLLIFLQEHNTERFNIIIDEDLNDYIFDLKELKRAKDINPNIHIVIKPYLENIQILKNLNISFYFPFNFAATNFRELEALIEMGVSDVYIADDLCYQLEKVHNICHTNNVQLRLLLDRVNSFKENANNDPKAPYFVPEVIEELAKYVDIFEFSENTSKARLNTLYRIWFEKKEWRDSLNYLYPLLEIFIPNQYLLPYFIAYRMNCGYKCAEGSVCKKCVQFLEIAQILYKKENEFAAQKRK